MVEQILMVLLGIMVSQSTCPFLSEVLMMPARGLWSPTYSNGFDLMLHRGVVAGTNCSWSVAVRKTVGDPAA
jgi:hypothetical protein